MALNQTAPNGQELKEMKDDGERKNYYCYIAHYEEESADHTRKLVEKLVQYMNAESGVGAELTPEDFFIDNGSLSIAELLEIKRRTANCFVILTLGALTSLRVLLPMTMAMEDKPLQCSVIALSYTYPSPDRWKAFNYELRETYNFQLKEAVMQTYCDRVPGDAETADALIRGIVDHGFTVERVQDAIQPLLARHASSIDLTEYGSMNVLRAHFSDILSRTLPYQWLQEVDAPRVARRLQLESEEKTREDEIIKAASEHKKTAPRASEDKEQFTPDKRSQQHSGHFHWRQLLGKNW